MNCDIDMRSVFEKGASDCLERLGVPSGEAAKVASEMGKEASRRSYRDDEEDEEGVLDSAKKWIMPAAVGVAALMLGDYFGKNGRRDRNAFQNAYDVIARKARDMTGTRLDSPLRAFDTRNLKIKDYSSVGVGRI